MLKKLNLKWGKKKSGEEERERERGKLTFFNLEFCTAKKPWPFGDSRDSKIYNISVLKCRMHNVVVGKEVFSLNTNPRYNRVKHCTVAFSDN